MFVIVYVFQVSLRRRQLISLGLTRILLTLRTKVLLLRVMCWNSDIFIYNIYLLSMLFILLIHFSVGYFLFPLIIFLRTHRVWIFVSPFWIELQSMFGFVKVMWIEFGFTASYTVASPNYMRKIILHLSLARELYFIIFNFY